MIGRFWCCVLALLVVGCTSSSDQSETTSTQPNDPSATSEQAKSSTTEESADSPSDAEASSVEPLRPYDEGPSTTLDSVSSSVYISRISMSDTSIEMTWSTFEGAVEYHLHRVPKTSEDEPGTELMTSDNRLHVATDIGRFVDDGVETGARYWYGIKALDSDGVLMAHGWHRADAVTDEEPPSPVGNLQVVLEGGEVLVSWDRPDENYELHSYQVLRGVDGEEPQVISNTWNLDQRSFIDDRPPVSGTVTYLVTSLDYHWNTSDPAEVTIDLPQ